MNVYPVEIVFSTHCPRIVVEILGEKASTGGEKSNTDSSGESKSLLTDEDKEKINKGMCLVNAKIVWNAFDMFE